MKSVGFTILGLLLASCNDNNKALSTAPFDADEAYRTIQKYEAFGPKVSGSDAHRKAAEWIVESLKKSGATVIEQKTSATLGGKTIPIRNLFAQLNPRAETRYLFSAHYDNRDIADQDVKNREQPIVGANDGGSGVAVLLGMARALQGTSPPFGIDFAFLDAEDLGRPGMEDSFCLGSQAFAKNPPEPGYKAVFGVNLDMVGRIGSVFGREAFSERVGASVYDKIRVAAKDLGAQALFPDFSFGPITDDHVYISKGLSFPVVDLIFMTPDNRFPPEWHTHQDTTNVISRDVLKQVGETLLQVLKNEQKQVR